MAAEQTIRPLVPTVVRTEFGDVLESDLFQQNRTVGQDLTYVPGWSDMRMEQDRQKAEVVAGKRSPNDVMTLPVRCQLVRTARISGEPDGVKPTMYGTDGYREVTKDDVGKPWLKSIPPGAKVTSEGGIRIGDTMLMVADAKTAAKNSAINQRETQRLLKNAGASELMRAGNTTRGADPTFETLPGTSVPVPRSAIKA